MQVAVRLLGFRGFPEVESALVDGVLMVSVADDATVANTLWRALVAGADGTILSVKIGGGFVGSMFGLYAYSGSESK